MIPANYNIVEGHTESVALFTNKPTNTAVQNVEESLYRPVSQLSSSSSYLEFSIPGTSKYLDLSKTKLNLQVKITRSDGAPLDSEDNVAFINLPLQTMFSQVDVSLNQIPINKIPAPLYAYKSYLDVLLNNGEEAKESWLQGQLYHSDTPGHLDNYLPYGLSENAGLNAGLVTRWSHTQESRLVELEGPLHVDFFHQPRYLLNNVSVHVKLWQSPDSFRLMGDTSKTSYRVQIVDAALKVTGITVTPEIILAHEQCLMKTPALYPMYQSDFKVFAIAKGDLFFAADNLWNSQVPSKVYIMLTSAQGFNGDFTKNPLNLQHCNLNYLSFTVDGISKPASKPLTPDFENDKYTEAFLSLFSASNMMGKNVGCDISRYGYKHGYTIFGLDLDGNHSSDYLPLPKQSHIRIEAKFSKPLEESVNMLVYAKFPTCLKIDQARNVVM